jgi:hypothetical protein
MIPFVRRNIPLAGHNFPSYLKNRRPAIITRIFLLNGLTSKENNPNGKPKCVAHFHYGGLVDRKEGASLTRRTGTEERGSFHSARVP